MARILAVDDSEQNLTLIELYLKGTEFELVTAGSGRDALDLAWRQRFDLILLDVVMPGIDGFEVLRRLKNDPRTAFVPVIFLTARMTDESGRSQAYEMGAVDYIQKPVHKEELVARIAVMLRLEEARNRLERENAALRSELQETRRGLEEAGNTLEELQRLADSEVRTTSEGVLLLDRSCRVIGADAFARSCLPGLEQGRELQAGGHAAARLQRLLVDGARRAELSLPVGEALRPVEVQVLPLEPGDLLAVRLCDRSAARAVQHRLAERQVAVVESRPPGTGYAIAGFIGGTAQVQGVAAMVDRLRQGRATVLIHGESGTGRELVARALHFDGPHRHGPFIPIHCGAISPELIESELFGYEKGAFTGAQTSREGLFSVADGGTIFLDEIAETSTDLQVKLLRVLQMGEIRPVGANQPRIVDVRILAATNRDLRAMVREGRFREDLYYRLGVVTIELPPLRDRLRDIPLLVEHFVRKFNQRYGRDKSPVQGMAQAAMARLLAYPWPGNVRELEHVLDRAFALGCGDLVQEEDLPPHVIAGRSVLADSEPAPAALPVPTPLPLPALPTPVVAAPPAPSATAPGLDLRSARQQAERDAILRALQQSQGDKPEAARALGMSRSTFYRRLKELGL